MGKMLKLNNWKNNIIICSRCGKDIRHHYSVEGVDGVYGIDCALSVIGSSLYNSKLIEKLMKDIEILESTNIPAFLSDKDKKVSLDNINTSISEKLLEIEKLKNV